MQPRGLGRPGGGAVPGAPAALVLRLVRQEETLVSRKGAVPSLWGLGSMQVLETLLTARAPEIRSSLGFAGQSPRGLSFSALQKPMQVVLRVWPSCVLPWF